VLFCVLETATRRRFSRAGADFRRKPLSRSVEGRNSAGSSRSSGERYDGSLRCLGRDFDPDGAAVLASPVDRDARTRRERVKELELERRAGLSIQMDIDEKRIGLPREHAEIDHAVPIELVD